MHIVASSDARYNMHLKGKLMITCEEILSIEEYCAEHRISHKDRLEKLGIFTWSYCELPLKEKEIIIKFRKSCIKKKKNLHLTVCFPPDHSYFCLGPIEGEDGIINNFIVVIKVFTLIFATMKQCVLDYGREGRGSEFFGTVSCKDECVRYYLPR